MNTEASRTLINPRSSSTRTVSIAGTGCYAPERVMTNADLERLVDTSDEWIYTRTGIRERHIAAQDEATSDMAAEAARRAMKEAGIEADDIDMIVVATCTPDMFFPSTACFVQKQIGASRAFCMDLSAACSGFLYAMEVGQQFISTASADTVLVIGAEKMSSVLDWRDRSTCVLFGDGAGAAVLQSRGAEYGIMTTVLGSNGNLSDLLSIPGGGSRNPLTAESLEEGMNTLRMAGREVFKHAVTSMSNAVLEALRRCGASIDDVDCIIPHQANARIIQAIGQRVGAPIEKFYLNVDRFGNTSAASIIMALDEAVRNGRIKNNDLVLLVVFGGGFTWAASLVEW